MGELEALGPAAVTEERLAAMVADQWGVDRAEVLTVSVETVDYDLAAITTAARHWVRGTGRAEGAAEPRDFAFFVKHVQCWSRSEQFRLVPEHLREIAAATVPWRTEPMIYRSDLADRLPEGLSMPACRSVFDLDERSAAIWLDVVVPDPLPWDDALYARAARCVGRLAASPRTRELADVAQVRVGPRGYYAGRLAMQVIPMLRSDDLWAHPLVAGAFDDALRARLLDCADRAGDLAEELAAMPARIGHGDTSPNNLLPVGDGFVLIDYGFWEGQPIGFDLAQLVVGDVQLGRFPAEGLLALDRLCLAAYVEGLRDEGDDTPAETVARAHALKTVLFSGLSAVPWEHLGEGPSPELDERARTCAAIATYALDRLDETALVSGSR